MGLAIATFVRKILSGPKRTVIPAMQAKSKGAVQGD